MRRLLAVILFVVASLSLTFSVSAQDDDPFADFDFLFLIGDATANPSIAGPLSGELAIEAGTTYIEPANVGVRDFYAYAEFTNPYPASHHLFDIGFSFRHTGNGEEFRLVIDSLGDWYFKQAGVADTISGSVPSLKTGAGETNEIDLVAFGDLGYFAVNGEYVGSIDLTARPMKGDVAVGAGYYAEDQLTGERAPFARFEVWSLDEVLPTGAEAEGILQQLMSDAQSGPSGGNPLAGEIPLESGSVNGISAESPVRDFHAHAEFTNPYPASEHPWDIGFGFRDTGDDELRIAVDAQGTWLLSRGSAPILDTGSGALLNTGAGGRNTVDLVAVGGIGYLAVNGQYVTTLDLGAVRASGDVWAGAGFYAENKRDGAITPFTGFQVWSLDPLPADGGSGIIVSSDGEVIFDLPRSGDEGLFGVVSLTAAGERTRVEIGAFDATGDEFTGIYAAPCAWLPGLATFDLNPIDADSLTSSTIIDAPFADLTTGAYAIAVRADDTVESVLACSDIPLP